MNVSSGLRMGVMICALSDPTSVVPAPPRKPPRSAPGAVDIYVEGLIAENRRIEDPPALWLVVIPETGTGAQGESDRHQEPAEAGDLSQTAQEAAKLAVIRPILAFHEREHDMELRLFTVGGIAFVGLHARTVLLISRGARPV